jgi:hypothetical protein
MNRTLTLLIAVLLVVGSAACGSSESDEAGTSPQDQYVGTWRTGNGFYSIHGADGTWKVGFTLTSAESSPVIWGTYAFDGTTMTSVTDEASQSCAGVTAVYEIEVSEDGNVITSTPIDDPCQSVRGSDTAQITRYVP